LPTVSFTEDTIVIYSGETVTLTPTVNNAIDYTWSTGETTSTITVDSTGTYYLTVSNDCGSVIDSIYVDVLTNIQTSKMLNVTNVYPNPATDFIQILGYTDGFEKIEIFAQDGRCVTQINKKISNKIDISTLNNGVYPVVISQLGKSAQLTKIVVLK
jgi:hypothetical protein